MYKKASLLFLICESPLHAGSGSDLGVIDLPIQRERHTSFPKIESSSLKGSIREAFEGKLSNEEDRKKIHLAFGYDDKTPEGNGVKKHFGDDKQFQGALGFTDARLLLFPVKSMKGVFAWITCKKVLEQFKRDFELTKTKLLDDVLREIPKENTDHNSCVLQGIPEENTVSRECGLIVSGSSIVLEEYTFRVTEDEKTFQLADWLAKELFEENSYWQNHLKKNLVVLSNDDFTDFVNLSTEVVTRTKIDNETGTVQDGALFTEEYLPAESILYSLALFSPLFHNVKTIEPFMKYIEDIKKQNPDCNDSDIDERVSRDEDKEVKAIWEFFKNIPSVLQIGGNATIGKGLVRTKVLGGK